MLEPFTLDAVSYMLQALNEFSLPVMISCPSSHPWAISNGGRCCSSFEVPGDPLATIQFEAPSSECQGESIACNNYNWDVKCKSNDQCELQFSCMEDATISRGVDFLLVMTLSDNTAPYFRNVAFDKPKSKIENKYIKN